MDGGAKKISINVKILVSVRYLILLKDGVRYLPYSYKSEEELEDIVAEHYKEIFGERSLLFGKKTMKTSAGVASRNDGIVISLHENKWFIIENELSQHDLYTHIVPQITKFSNAYKSLGSRKKIVNALYQAIKVDPIKNAIFQKEKIGDIHKFLTDLIDFQPTIVIIIDSKTQELDEVTKSLPFPTIAIEFKTFVREGVGSSVHIHLFEPIFKKKIAPVFDTKEKVIFPQAELKTYMVHSRTTKIPRALEQILAVVKIMYQGKSFAVSVKKVARELGVKESTVRDKCTRQLSLNTDKFIEIAEDRDRLKLLLQAKFPKYNQLILNEL